MPRSFALVQIWHYEDSDDDDDHVCWSKRLLMAYRNGYKLPPPLVLGELGSAFQKVHESNAK